MSNGIALNSNRHENDPTLAFTSGKDDHKIPSINSQPNGNDNDENDISTIWASDVLVFR
jgi:hypothetical protein